MLGSIEFSGIIALYLNPRSPQAEALEASFSRQNVDGLVRIQKKDENLFKVTLVHQSKTRDAISSIAEKNGLSKGKARKVFQERIDQWVAENPVPVIGFDTTLFDAEDEKDGVIRQSKVCFVDEASTPLRAYVDKLCQHLGITSDENRQFHLSAFNLTGNSSDSPSLV